MPDKQKKLPMIEVQTLPNGYSLKFDGMSSPGGYLYYNPDKLLQGVMLHIGLNMTEQLNTETMADFIATAIAWKDNRKCVEEIQLLSMKLRVMTSKRAGMAEKLVAERKLYNNAAGDIRSLLADLKQNRGKDPIKELEKLASGIKKRPALELEDLKVKDSDFMASDREIED